YPGVFGSTSLLNLTDVGVELSIADASFGLDMATKNGSLINVIGLTDSSAQNVSAALQAGNLTTSTYNGLGIYRLSSAPVAGSGGAWVCVYNSVLILCEGEDIALEGVKSVIDAGERPFFSSDALKVGYLLSVNGREVLAFTYYEAGGDPYNVDWEMRGVSNSSGLAVRDVDALASIEWSKMVLDEAQVIKNPTSETAQLLRRIDAHIEKLRQYM
ncbi:MAG TPA: hypothetical protein PKX17_07560, partial [Candidatus Methanomethylicus sp.]|nr:hypothetical protein [Candidatus Methanomethylicus sp.]